MSDIAAAMDLAKTIKAPAPSPFFKGTTLQFAWDQTSLGLLMECPFKYKLSILDGWRKKDSSVHLTFGKHFADAMEGYHKALAKGLDHDEALDMVLSTALCATGFYDAEGAWHSWQTDDTKKNRETLIRSIIWYFETYKDDQMKTVILPDGTPAVELLFMFESGIASGYGEFLMTGHIDRLVDFDDTKFVLDNKTTGAALGGYYFRQYDTDNQMSQYTYAGKVCYNVPVQGVVIDAAQIMVGFTAFGRGITTRSTSQLEEWHGNAALWLNLAERFYETGVYPMNLKSCNNYGACVFRDVCGSSPEIRENILKTYFEKRNWNPLEVR